MIPTRLAPLGDQAVLAYFDDEAAAVRFTESLRSENPPWLEDVVPAYAGAGVFFNADAISTREVMSQLNSFSRDAESSERSAPLRRLRVVAKRHTIPVCYEFGPDLPRVCERTGLAADDAICFHLGTEYVIHAIGFVPGFPYLGYLPEELCGVPRLESPRLRVEPGSVALTGRQTGIYPLPRPGGWNLIGRTPLAIVDVAEGFFPLRVGDRVTFTRIDEKRFRELDGERLSSPAR